MTLPHRYVFVGGLHRSGTSLITKLMSELPGVSAIQGAPIPENEGVYLQGAIPHTAQHGIPGAFAEDPNQRHTEASPHNSLATRRRLEADWDPWFDHDAAWRAEKSPVNLLRMRLYQQLFPLAQFVIVTRHPQAVAAATAKWSDRSQDALLSHWETAYDLALQDLPYLHAWMIVRYEDLMANPRAELRRLAAFLSLRDAELPDVSEVKDRNPNYGPFDQPMSETAHKLGYGGEKALVGGRHPLSFVQDRIDWARPLADAA